MGDDEEVDAQLDETKDEEEDDKEEEEEDEEDEEQVLKRREQLLAKKLTAVEPYDCKKLNRPVQVLRENEAGSVFAVKTLGIKKGTYKTLYTIPYERTSPPFDDINSCAISPVSDIVYCAITLDGGNDYMARIDSTQIEFVAKLPNADSKYIAAAFSKKGNFHFSEGKGNSVYLGTISGVDDLPGFPDQNNPALGDYTDTPRSKVIKVADWVAFMADIKGNNKVLWNNEEILTSLPSHFENQLISASRYKNAMLVQDPFRQGQAPGLDVHFPLNMNLHMTEGENGLGVRITMPPAPGGQDGLCGNFNGVGDDDTSELVSKRPGARIAAEELLFRNSFVLPHIQ